MEKYVIGIDYGTDSVRALIVNAHNGSEEGTGVSYYKRWKEKKYCDATKNQFRQHPLDYIESLEEAVKEAVNQAKADVVKNIAAISFDTTGSTPVATDRSGIPLAMQPEFAENPNAMFILWKDHTAVKEAAEINELVTKWGGVDYTKYEGGIYSSEWFWAKILRIMRVDEKVRRAAYSWVEHCDWIPALLTGASEVKDIKRSRCAAGHKAMWHPEWGGLPSEEFLTKLDPLLSGVREKLYTETFTSDQAVGVISKEWAKRLGLPENILIGVGAFDAHLGAVGAEIKPYYLTKVMGTSTCDMVVAPNDEMEGKLVKGICGQVDGSIIPGMMGLEAGQSSFGDVYAWFKDLLMWPVLNLLDRSNKNIEIISDNISESIIEQLTVSAIDLDPEETGLVAIDWLNGRRTPDANQELSGAIAGITLGTDAPAIFRALVEATAFGSKRIVDRFINEGVPIHGVIGLGGVAKKSPFIMQIMADVLNMSIQVVKHEQTCALGTAMAASVVAALNKDFSVAQNVMGNGFEKTYNPRPEFVKKYERIYKKYCKLGDSIENM